MLKKPTDQSLATVATGRFRCQRINADGVEALRIKRMGLCEGLIVEVLGTGDPLIVGVGHSRLGLSRFIARKIEVCSLGEDVTGEVE